MRVSEMSDEQFDQFIAEAFLDAFIEVFTEDEPDPSVLTDEDHAALESLGDDLVDRLLQGSRP